MVLIANSNSKKTSSTYDTENLIINDEVFGDKIAKNYQNNLYS